MEKGEWRGFGGGDRLRSSSLFGVLVAVLGLSLLLAADALAAVGGLTQKAGVAGCVSETGGGGACAGGRGLDGANQITVSPDGANAYLASQNSDAVVIFDRNPATGALTQKAGTAGCISESGSGGACFDGRALDTAITVALAPDGANAYVASSNSDAVAIFDRNPATGALTQKAGTAGCISEAGVGGCSSGKALDGPGSVIVSPDGSSVYVASSNSDAVAIFDRNATTGVLTQKAGTAGCISETGAGPCVNGAGLDDPIWITLSPNGAGAYVSSFTSGAVAIFDRNTATGALTQKAGTAGCVSESGAPPCADGAALSGAFVLAVSADGASAYVASFESDAVAIFDRNTVTGALTQKAGAAGCISETGAAPCADGTGLDSANSVALSPDGASVYATAFADGGTVSIFDRNTATGGLTQKPGAAGCISQTGTAPCAAGTALSGATWVTISPDGANAYTASFSSDAASIFDRDLPPQTTIDSGPSGPSNDRTPTFTFSSSDAGSSFQCRLDGASFGPCSGPGSSHTAGSLGDGAHSFQVRAIDPAANSDPTPAVRNFAVDTVGPKTKITKKPKKKVKTGKRKTKVKVSFESEAGATFRCKLDKSKFKACSSPFKAKAKAKSKAGKGKKHTISIEATDEAGNVERKPARATFRLIRKR